MLLFFFLRACEYEHAISPRPPPLSLSQVHAHTGMGGGQGTGVGMSFTSIALAAFDEGRGRTQLATALLDYERSAVRVASFGPGLPRHTRCSSLCFVDNFSCAFPQLPSPSRRL